MSIRRVVPDLKSGRFSESRDFYVGLLGFAYPLTDEPWGVRRFFVQAPNGVVINVQGHIG